MKQAYLRFIFLLLIIFVFSITSYAQTSGIFVKKISVNFPEYLFKSVGSKTSSVQYIKLFKDKESKGYILKAWVFQPVSTKQTGVNYKIRTVSPDGKSEYFEELAGVRDGSYVRLPQLLVIIPAKYTLYVNSQVIDGEKNGSSNGGDLNVPIFGDSEKAGIRLLLRTATGYREVSDDEQISKDDVVLLQIVAGRFPTGGYRIELNEPDIVYPVGSKPGKITFTGTFYRPKPTDMVTQAFTTPSKTVEIGKLPAGQYEIVVDIKDLGEFRKVLNVK